MSTLCVSSIESVVSCSLVGSAVSYNSSPSTQFLKTAIHPSVPEAFFTHARRVSTDGKQLRHPRPMYPIQFCALILMCRICSWYEWKYGSGTKWDMLCAQKKLKWDHPGGGSISSRAYLRENSAVGVDSILVSPPD